MSGEMKIERALILVNQLFQRELLQIEIDYELSRIKAKLNAGIMLYIQYNDFDEYAYNLIFSEKLNDRVRFDNYDPYWECKTNPHHFHPRLKHSAISSPMTGDPDRDLKILYEMYKKKVY